MTAPGSPTSLRCLHYLPSILLEEGGVTRAVLDLCAVMAARGHRVTLVTWNASDAPPQWLKGDPSLPRVITVSTPISSIYRLDRGSLQQADQLLAEADLVHLHGVWTTSNIQIAKLARRRRVPYLVSVHGMLDDWSMAQRRLKKRFFLATAGKLFLEEAAAVHLTARAEAEQACRWFPRGRPVVLPYIFDLAPFAELPGPDPARQAFAALRTDEPVVLFLSRVHPKKGIEPLIAASALLGRENVKHRLVIAGPGEPAYLAHLRRLVAQEKLDGSVEFVGTVRGLEKISLYQAARMLVLPTSQENFGLVLIEALACGTPVVTTRGVDIWREIETAGGLIADPSPPALAAAIRRLLADPAAAQRGQRGRAWVKENLDPDRLAQQYEAIYQQAAGGMPTALGGHGVGM